MLESIQSCNELICKYCQIGSYLFCFVFGVVQKLEIAFDRKMIIVVRTCFSKVEVYLLCGNPWHILPLPSLKGNCFARYCSPMQLTLAREDF